MENKTSKYFKYAIGEIVLVMIGILLALQVNIWNETRKVNNDIDKMFSLLESELENNISNTSRLIRSGYMRDSIRVLFKNNQVTRQMIYNYPSFVFRDFGTHTLFVQDERLNEIIAHEKQLPKNYQPLMTDLKRLKTRIESRRFWESKTLELSMQRVKEKVDETPYFGDKDSLAFNNFVTRALEDKIYRNKVEHYNNLFLDENVWDATLIKTSSVILLWKLKSAKDDSLTLEEFLKSLKLKPFIENSCNDSNFKEFEVLFRRNFIIYNSQSEEVILIKVSINDGDKATTILPAKNFLMGQWNLDENSYLEIEIDDNCKKIFDPYNEDYLIL
jgi:hypothetical protein